MPRLKLLFAVPECFPFAKTGGLGDVAGALPLALAERGHDVRVVMPRYQSVMKHPSTLLTGPLAVPLGYGTEWCGVHRMELTRGKSRVPVYALEHNRFFDRDGVYGDKAGSFGDNLSRYAFLSRGSLEICHYLGWFPDVVHVHDWPTSLVPLMLDEEERGSPLFGTASVISIHNMGYQGWFGLREFDAIGLGRSAIRSLEMHGRLNLLKGGLLHSTLVSTVSPTYAREIQGDGGEGLEGILRQRRPAGAMGVLNGIDDEAWNPEIDPHLPHHFSASDTTGKALCKAALQREVGLPERPDVPLFGVVSRLVNQKGIDLIAEALPRLAKLDVQVVILGSGEAWAERSFAALSNDSSWFRARFGMNEGLAHRVEAGIDFFLMPSRYEPCGLNQMYSQRYGALPIVRAVGGLDDTVENGVTGFKFDELSADALFYTALWAVNTYRDDPQRFRAMQMRAMEKHQGWDVAARQYEALYRLASRLRRR